MKLPFIQFFPSDYVRDTRMLSLAAKGGWMDIICMLHSSSTRGRMTLPVVGWARIMGASVDQAEAVLSELETMHTADIERIGNGDVTIDCRRMLRESITREQTRLRVQRHRRNAADDTGGNANETGQKTECRSQKLETKKTIQPLGAASSLEDLAVDSSPVVLVFACAGNPPSWELRESFVDRLRELYPQIDPLAECRVAAAKVEAGAVTKKTARGMAKFLFSWMDRTTNRAPSIGGRHKPATMR